MSIEVDRKGRFVIRWRPTGRHGPHKSFVMPAHASRMDAEDYEKILLSQIGKDVRLDPARTISRLYPDFIQYAEDHMRPATLVDIRSVYKCGLLPFFGAKRIPHLTANDISEYQHARIKQVAHKTINKEVTYLFSLLNWARDINRIKPAQPLSYKPLKTVRPIPIVLTHEEALAFCAAADGIWRPFFTMLYSLGVRFSEAARLTWPDIDFTADTVTVIRKGGKTSILPMPPMLVEELAQLDRESRDEEDEGKHTSPWVFPARSGGGHVISSGKAVERARSKAGISKKVYPHLLRHSLATNLISRNVSLRSVQEILGHSSYQMTEWYAGVVVENKRAALGTLFGKGVRQRTHLSLVKSK